MKGWMKKYILKIYDLCYLTWGLKAVYIRPYFRTERVSVIIQSIRAFDSELYN